jgi:hypothetical protein
MVSFAPNFAALLKQSAQPFAPAAQSPHALGAGTGMTEPPRLKYSPKLAALIDSRRKALDPATMAPTNTLGGTRG